jgi:hypothetical protein
MVDASLREHFDRAVAGDPGIDPGEMAHAAIAEGGRIRRRRKRMVVASAAAGLVTVFGVVAGLNLLTGAPRSEDPPVTIAAAMMPVAAPSCSAKPVDRDATDVLIFLVADATDRQRTALESALGDDARVGSLLFENREQAYQRFRARWARNPDLVAAVGANQFPESFRLRLVNASQYTALRGQYAAMAGVEQIIGRTCPASAPVGGTL